MNLAEDAIIFPRCGLIYADLKSTVSQHRTKKAVAAKLGVSDNQLDRVVKRYGLDHLFGRKPGELFAGVTAADLLRAASQCANMREAARRFGISQSYFTKKVKEIGATTYFKREKHRKRCVTKRQITILARQGYTRPDVAFLLGISASYLKDLITLWDLSGKFSISGGKAAAITRFGYAWSVGRKSV